jgi:hypothetical protein
MSEDLEQRMRGVEQDQVRSEVAIENLQKSVDRLTEAVEQLNTYASKTKGAWGFVLAAGAMMTAMVEGLRALFHQS